MLYCYITRAPIWLGAILLAAASPAVAEPPRVVTDIPPVHALVSQVMQGVGEPDLLISGATSPHDTALRPSQARNLANAQAIFFVSEDLTPWIARATEALAEGAVAVSLLDAPGTTVLPFRTTFEQKADDDHGHEAHAEDDHNDHAEEEHAHDEEGHDEHGHEEHAEDAHEHEEHAHDDDGHDGEDHAAEAKGDDDHGHAHDHDGADPHAWLDPDNAVLWLDHIAETLAALDPDNAATYAQNAAAAAEAIDTQAHDLEDRLAAAKDARFVVFHDAYQYFENRFGLSAAGAISLGDAADPGPARLAAVRDTVRDSAVACVLHEPQFDPALARTVIEGTDATLVEIDPLGATLTPGPDLYPALIEKMATQLAACR